MQFRDETLAECHHFPVRFSLGIKIGPALAAADGKACQGIFENLFKTQELDNTQVHTGMQTKASLVRPYGRIELHAESVVHLYLSLVIHPGNAENKLSLRRYNSLQQGVPAVLLLIGLNHHPEGFQNLLHSLVKFGLRGILCNYQFKYLINI